MEERRAAVRRGRVGLSAAALIAGAACACELPAGVRLDSARYAASFRTVPQPIAVGTPFVLELAVCPRDGAGLPARLRLDATMPEHRHGMNYRPQVTQTGAGRYRAEGWLLHMPGRWEFVFDLDGDRLTYSLQLE